MTCSIRDKCFSSQRGGFEIEPRLPEPSFVAPERRLRADIRYVAAL
jgi:hypothetical protein